MSVSALIDTFLRVAIKVPLSINARNVVTRGYFIQKEATLCLSVVVKRATFVRVHLTNVVIVTSGDVTTRAVLSTDGSTAHQAGGTHFSRD